MANNTQKLHRTISVFIPRISIPRKMLNLARQISEIPGNSLRCKHKPVSISVTSKQITAIPVVFLPRMLLYRLIGEYCATYSYSKNAGIDAESDEPL